MLVEHFLPNQSFRCRAPLLSKTCSGVAEINGEVHPPSFGLTAAKPDYHLMTNHNGPHLYCKGRVSRFGACASDDVSAVKLIVFEPIRSECTTPAGYYSLLAGYL